MSSGCGYGHCTSTDLGSPEHVERQLMCSSFKGPPGENENNGATSEGHRGAEIETGGACAEQNMDASVGGLLLGGADARGDSDSDDSRRNLSSSEGSSPSSDEGFALVKKSQDSSSESRVMRSRLNESEQKKRELEKKLSECEQKKREFASRLSASEERRRDLEELLDLTQRQVKELEESLDAKDRKLDVKRREIVRLKRYLEVYENDFRNLNDRARAAEENAYNAASGWVAIRQFLYENQLGLASLQHRSASDLSTVRRQAERLTLEAQDEAHDRETLTYPWSSSQHMQESTVGRGTQDHYEIAAPLPVYFSLEVDSAASEPIIRRAVMVSHRDEEAQLQHDGETLVVDQISAGEQISAGINRGVVEQSNIVNPSSLAITLRDGSGTLRVSCRGSEIVFD